MISVAEADRILAALAVPGGTETVPLDHAVDRLLAEPLTAHRDGPPYHRVAMDGYAVLSTESLSTWAVKGLQSAGRPPLERPGPGTAVEVATGAVLPVGCDAVVPYEHTLRDGDMVILEPDRPLPSPGVHVHHRGTDYLRDQVLIPGGTRLRSPHLHSLATEGISEVRVVRRPVWALAATGDELVEIHDRPRDWQIRRSNAAAIAGEARAWGLSPRDQTVLPDEKTRLTAGLERVLPGLDVLVLTGGVSAGVLDLVPGVLADLGAVTLFHKIAQRPGKPLWCGRFPDAARPGTLVFGLPGNPVSSLFAFRRYVLPWLMAAEGRPLGQHRVSAPNLPLPPVGQTVFLPWSGSKPLEWKGSGDFLALGSSEGFIEMESTTTDQPKFHPWGGRF